MNLDELRKIYEEELAKPEPANAVKRAPRIDTGCGDRVHALIQDKKYMSTIHKDVLILAEWLSQPEMTKDFETFKRDKKMNSIVGI